MRTRNRDFIPFWDKGFKHDIGVCPFCNTAENWDPDTLRRDPNAESWTIECGGTGCSQRRKITISVQHE